MIGNCDAPDAACKGERGTHKGYQRHRAKGQDAGQPCVDARNAYMQSRRRGDPAIRKAESDQQRARGRAYTRLKGEYPQRYRQLLIEETIKIELERK